MKKIAFTISAKNYIGLAKILEKSISENDPSVDFYIFVADECTESLQLPNNAIIAKNHLGISTEKWNEMAFKYDLTEFCTFIKPYCFQYIFSHLDADKVIYFDPDILVYHDLNCIYDELDDHSILLTPHIAIPEIRYTGDLLESAFLKFGIFNLGFLALRNDNSVHIMLEWWAKRLDKFCFRFSNMGYFTDQVWMDFIPAFFAYPICKISSHLGMNVAPWNIHERELLFINSGIEVQPRNGNSSKFPLIFVHFSGLNYKSVLEGKLQGSRHKIDFQFEDYKVLMKKYVDYVGASAGLLNEYLSLTYTYSVFDNGIPIVPLYRRLYRRLKDDERISTNPFESIGNSFYLQLRNNKLLFNKVEEFERNNRFDSIRKSSAKIKFFNKVMSLLFRIVGVKRFFMLIKIFSSCSNFEYHAYLLDNYYIDKTSKGSYN